MSGPGEARIGPWPGPRQGWHPKGRVKGGQAARGTVRRVAGGARGGEGGGERALCGGKRGDAAAPPGAPPRPILTTVPCVIPPTLLSTFPARPAFGVLAGRPVGRSDVALAARGQDPGRLRRALEAGAGQPERGRRRRTTPSWPALRTSQRRLAAEPGGGGGGGGGVAAEADAHHHGRGGAAEGVGVAGGARTRSSAIRTLRP